MFDKPIISSYIKSKGSEWVGHIWSSKEVARNIFYGRLNGKKPRGRPRQIWAKKNLTEISKETRIIRTTK